LNVESTRQTNGLNLWMNQVNEAGGIPLADGTRVTVSSVFYDDESNGERVQELYTRLATEDNADFLISPYSSGLTASASVIAEQYGKPMITTGAASDSNYMQGYTLVFQAYTPASKYLTGAIDMMAAAAPDLRRIAIVHENDRFSTDVATAAQAYAQEQGYEIVLFEGYDSGTTDFAPVINKVTQAAPEAVLGGGHFQDGSTFARQLAEKNVPLQYLFLLVAPPEPTFAELGDAALGVAGPSQWEPQVTFSGETAQAAGVEFYGPSAAEFVEAYEAAYGGEEPSYHAAGGYVAGLLLQAAIERAGSTDAAAVKGALDALDVMTFFGRNTFDTSAEAHGLQTGHEMVYVQWQRNDAGELVKQVIWPEEGKTADAIAPVR
jgi:branched-chain amino acid transport system substrate-binding protein